MRPLLALAVLSLALSTGVAPAAETPASAASVRVLLEASGARRLVDGMMNVVSGSFEQGMHAAIGDKELSPAQQKFVDSVKASFLDTVGQAMSWSQLEPVYLEVYTQSFSQSEVDGLIAFYRSPTGIAFKDKMPAVMQLTMQKMQPIIATMTAKMQQQQRELLEKLAAELRDADPQQ